MVVHFELTKTSEVIGAGYQPVPSDPSKIIVNKDTNDVYVLRCLLQPYANDA
jgi:hypothetical protein